MELTSSESSSEDEYILLHVVRERRPRVFRERINFSQTITDFEFNEKFRVSKQTVEYILSKIGEQLHPNTGRNNPLTPVQQVLSFLRWAGCGAQYHVVADTHGVSKQTIHKCVKRVSTLMMSELFGEEIRWPSNCDDVPRMFMSNNIPRIAGIVDGSLVKLDAPHQNEVAFVDRNGNHSINVMIVAGPNLEIFYASARWPGSVHDSRVMRCSSLAQRWESGWRPFPNAIILGDSGYGLRKWLITPNIPVEIPRTESLERFLRAFKSTRRMVENALGIIKEKFPCLNYLRVQPTVASNIILSCIILHNIEKRLGSDHYIPYSEQIDNDAHENNFDDTDEVALELPHDSEAIEVLRQIIQLFDD